jgi:hypothetical protein
MNRATAKDFISTNVLGSQEVQEMLKVTRSRLKALVDEGKLKPIKQLSRENLFWLPDVEALKKLYLKDKKSNLYKLAVKSIESA